MEEQRIAIIGAGLAGTEAALALADAGVRSVVYEMRPAVGTAVHKTGLAAELVCSNSLKSEKPESAAGMLKRELGVLGSHLYRIALETRVPAGGALAVDRTAFSREAQRALDASALIEVVRREAPSLERVAQAGFGAVIVATGPLTSDALARDIERVTGTGSLAFYDAAAPIVMADSLDRGVVFRQSRYEDASDERGAAQGDYLNAPFERDEYERFVDALTSAKRVIARDFETRDLFQACQPIEELARKGRDTPRFGTMKPVGLVDPRTGRRPWAAVQLRAENAEATSYNLVGFQTNLRFGEQERVFRMIPGLEHAEFARFGVMHRNTFLDAPRLLDASLRLRAPAPGVPCPVYFAGQVAGTEGYCEAIRSGLHAAISVAARLSGFEPPALPRETAFGALMSYATDPATRDYQPMHVNRGILPPLEAPERNRAERYAAYARRAAEALDGYAEALRARGLIFEGGGAHGR